MTETKNPNKHSGNQPRFYSLDTAAIEACCNKQTILEYAARGLLSVYALAPPEVDVCSIDISSIPMDTYKKNNIKSFTIYLPTSKQKSNPVLQKDIQLLKLSSNDCRQIQHQGYIKQSIFEIAIQENDALPQSQALQEEIKKEFHHYKKSTSFLNILTRRFATCKKQPPEIYSTQLMSGDFPCYPITINDQALLISNDESLKNIINQHNQEEATLDIPTNSKKPIIDKMDPKAISQRLYVPTEFRTALLHALYMTARDAFRIQLTNNNKYPERKKVEEIFKKRSPKCSNSLAENAASLVRPIDNSFNTDPVCEFNGKKFLTNQFWMLVDAYDKYYKNINPENYDENYLVIEYFERNFGMGERLAKVCTEIINPTSHLNSLNKN